MDMKPKVKNKAGWYLRECRKVSELSLRKMARCIEDNEKTHRALVEAELGVGPNPPPTWLLTGVAEVLPHFRLATYLMYLLDERPVTIDIRNSGAISDVAEALARVLQQPTR